MTSRFETDVFIIGTGPIAAAFARELVPTGRQVTMVDAGAAHSARPGRSMKNFYAYQRHRERAADLAKGILHPLSVSPVEGSNLGTRIPVNPRQDPSKNLDGAATAYAVGGMGIQWTHCIPRQHPKVERSALLSDAEWDEIYTRAEELLFYHNDLFESGLRHTIVKEAVGEFMNARLEDGRRVQHLPLAIERHPSGRPGLLHYSASDTILGPVLDEPESKFRILSEHLVRKLHVSSGKVVSATVENLQTGDVFDVHANQFVVCAGTVLTAQLLWASDIRPEALGRYMFEHPIIFSQVFLNESLRAAFANDPRFTEARKTASPDDPLQLPANDWDPNVWIPVTEKRPWHVQVTKEVVHYTPEQPDVDDRAVIDLRWFGSVDPRPENRVTFESDLTNQFGMPQPTMHFEFSDNDQKRLAAMESEMRELGETLGTWATTPRLLPKGICFHIQGTTRMGGQDDGTSVCDTQSKVWGHDNLFVGGNSVIPTSNACNPTLTSVALAVRSARSMGA